MDFVHTGTRTLHRSSTWIRCWEPWISAAKPPTDIGRMIERRASTVVDKFARVYSSHLDNLHGDVDVSTVARSLPLRFDRIRGVFARPRSVLGIRYEFVDRLNNFSIELEHDRQQGEAGRHKRNERVLAVDKASDPGSVPSFIVAKNLSLVLGRIELGRKRKAQILHVRQPLQNAAVEIDQGFPQLRATVSHEVGEQNPG